MPENPHLANSHPAGTQPASTQPAGAQPAADAEPDGLDPRGVRFTAAVTTAILAFGLVTGSWRVLAAQTVLFAMCAFLGLKLNPWGQIYRSTVQPRLEAVDPADRESPEPVRFAQAVGFAFALIATVGYAADWSVVGVLANAVALVAALLNAVFGHCLGCRAYPLIQRFAASWSAAGTGRTP